MTFKLGLTGSIGMGKSTTAQMFVEAGCALWDADATVHQLYAPNGPAIAPIVQLVPEALEDTDKGPILNRAILRDAIRADDTLLTKIEAIVHPMVKASRTDFIAETKADIAVFDIPLLFETKSEANFDAIACVYTDADTQKQRVLARGNMSEDDLALILSRQMPIDEKRKRADFAIKTDTLDHAKQQVSAILDTIRKGLPDA